MQTGNQRGWLEVQLVTTSAKAAAVHRSADRLISPGWLLLRLLFSFHLITHFFMLVVKLTAVFFFFFLSHLSPVHGSQSVCIY